MSLSFAVGCQDAQIALVSRQSAKSTLLGAQMEAAALLYFNGADSVAVHTLIAAAYEILQDLAAKRTETMWIERSLVATLSEKLARIVRAQLRAPQNFFKHANSDESAIEFSPFQSEIMLLDAIGKYLQITGEQPLLLRAFEKWCFLQHPDLLKSTARRV